MVVLTSQLSMSHTNTMGLRSGDHVIPAPLLDTWPPLQFKQGLNVHSANLSPAVLHSFLHPYGEQKQNRDSLTESI